MRICLAVVSFLIVPGWLVMATGGDKKKPMLPESNWDFSKSSDVTIVDWPADMMKKDGIATLGGPRKVSLRLANGKTISGIVDEVHAEKRGKHISWIALLYPKMELKNSVAVAREVVSTLDYKSTALDDWFDKAKDDLALNFEENFRGKKHELTIKILHSFDKSRPWRVKATIYLSAPPEKDEKSDEKAAEKYSS